MPSSCADMSLTQHRAPSTTLSVRLRHSTGGMVLRTGHFGGEQQVPLRRAFPAVSHQAIGSAELKAAQLIARRIIAQHGDVGNPLATGPDQVSGDGELAF